MLSLREGTITIARCMIGSTSSNPFLYLSTVGWETGKNHEIEIWFVEYSKRYYVMSEHGESAHWVQNIINNPRIKCRVYNITFEGTARIVSRKNEPQLAVEISKLMLAKYKWNEGTIVEILPPTLS
ncbi:MAG TPA: nitroreductase/quinone reductase family protein [Nitrososphaeraceae archaeon]